MILMHDVLAGLQFLEIGEDATTQRSRTAPSWQSLAEQLTPGQHHQPLFTQAEAAIEEADPRLQRGVTRIVQALAVCGFMTEPGACLDHSFLLAGAVGHEQHAPACTDALSQ
jgi:hypothetical protein